MKTAIIGSRNITNVDLSRFIPIGTTDIVSGGARGVDTVAKEYANRNGLKLTEFLPDYERFGRGAPLKRNITIIENADIVLVFWDGKSRGTKFVIDSCHRLGVEVRVHIVKSDTPDSIA